MPTTSVEPAALRAAAQRLDAAADAVAAAGAQMHRLQFDGSTAGRAHTGSGWALRAALDGLTAEIGEWEHAVRELAGALRAGAGLHAAGEAHAAAALR